MIAARDMNRLTDKELDQLCINTIRTLSIDAVQQAKSGRPGTPMARLRCCLLPQKIELFSK
jgi:transketolase